MNKKDVLSIVGAYLIIFTVLSLGFMWMIVKILMILFS